MPERDRQLARAIAVEAARQGGRVYYVGGLVRDGLLGRESKDVDIEVHGLAPQALEAILGGFGEWMKMGASFPVYGLRRHALDIALPRGEGPAEEAPFIGVREAARRRDFTIDAMMEDVLTGELVDPFGGRRDLAQGVIRHVDDATFVQDPLRVLRAAQLAARLGFSVAEETVSICRGLDLSALPGERVFGELQKALLGAPAPSVFFAVLREMDQLRVWFPEVEALVGVAQDPRHHPEGDAFRHTMQVLDQAAALRGQAEEPLAFMLSALCHDLGKATATRRNGDRIRSIGHERAGVPMAQALLGRMTGEKRLHRYVASMTLLHMRPRLLAAQGSGVNAFCRVFDQSACPRDLLLLARADALGWGGSGEDDAQRARMEDMLRIYEERLARPGVQGLDLIAAGFAPGEDFAGALAYAHGLKLSGAEKEDTLRQTIAYLRRARGMKS